MISKIGLPLGFVVVGVVCIYPSMIGNDIKSDFKLLAGSICILYGLGSLVYLMVKNKT